MIIRVLSVMLGSVLLYLLQTTFFPYIALASVVPDLLLILVCAVGFMRGRIPAMLTGLLCGLMIDCTYNESVGMFALFFLVIGYLSGFSHRIYDPDDYTMPIAIIAAGEFIYNLFYYIVFYFLDGKLNIGFYLFRFMVPRIIYTVLVSILVYRLINLINVVYMRFDKEV